jgi:hypothetical protein
MNTIDTIKQSQRILVADDNSTSTSKSTNKCTCLNYLHLGRFSR